ncbi:hypothetical protein PsJ27TS7_22280 [Paenibacillus dendritiformis]
MLDAYLFALAAAMEARAVGTSCLLASDYQTGSTDITKLPSWRNTFMAVRQACRRRASAIMRLNAAPL